MKRLTGTLLYLSFMLIISVGLFIVWLAWSGHYHALTISLGAVSCLVVAAIIKRMGLISREPTLTALPLRTFLYLPWLTWEVIKANIDVARRILSPSLPISPRIIKTRAGQRTDVGQVFYANSITLTPGTVSVDIAGDTITVHALTAEAADSLMTGEMDRRVAALEGDN